MRVAVHRVGNCWVKGIVIFCRTELLKRLEFLLQLSEPRVDSSSLIPALGESFSHAATSRIWLEYVPGVDPVRVRSVKLLKSSHCIVKRNPGKFRITQDGIKDA